MNRNLKQREKRIPQNETKRNEWDNEYKNTIFSCKKNTHALNGNYFIKSILLTENVRQIKEI